MKKIYYVIAAIALLELSFSKINTCYGQSAGKMPNVIFILADDLGYGDLKSFNPNAQIETPNIAKLANKGVIFTDAHSASSVCTPSRYGALTGRYAFRTSLKKGVLGGYSPALIEENRFTIADLFKNAGYNTAIIGKWHLGFDWKPLDPSKNAIQQRNNNTDLSNVDFSSPLLNGPNNVGFDYSYVLPASLDMSPYTYLENGVSTDYPLVPFEGKNLGRGIFWREGYASKSFKIENTLEEFINKAEQYISKVGKKQEQPFFLYLPLTAPHTPWLPSNKFKGKSGAGTYGDFVAYTDDAIGRILKALDKMNISDNTLIIFSSDNGADWKKADLAKYPKHQANYVFRGEKSDIWDGGHRIPLIMSWPAALSKQKVISETFCLTDLMATTANIINQKLPEGAGPDSYNFWPLIKNGQAVERPGVIHHSSEGMFAIRQGKWKFVDGNGSGGWSPKDANDNALGQLYDMDKDKAESTNLYDKYPEIVKELKSTLNKQKKQGYSVVHE